MNTDDYLVAREKKKKFDKIRVAYDTALSKVKNLTLAKKANQKKLDEVKFFFALSLQL